MSLSPKLEAAIGSWGAPPDLPAKVLLGIGVGTILLGAWGRGRSLLGIGDDALPKKTFLWLSSFSAALLSIVYIALYLRGGPRIVDATTYFLQGRAASHGAFAWPVAEPSASFRGRFLAYHDGAMGGIFPPGYPMLLALGFGLGAPMVVGPAIAALLVLATYRLAKTLAEDALRSEDAEPVARGAALLSIVCAALRYHTADTMSHGTTALGIALALDLALRAKRHASTGMALGAGLAIGAVAMTRPFSAIAIAIVTLVLLGRDLGLVVRVVLGALPGLGVLAIAQHAVTGAWLASSQRMYYANSDGPAGCFRWGFGKDVGCLYEHGEFVVARLPNGYGLAAAAGVTLRRLHLHLRDVLGLEPLALLVLAPLAPKHRTTGGVAAIALVLLHVLAYAPFYFDGSYPGGGARFFADVLPVEHAVVALALARWARSRAAPDVAIARASMIVTGLSLAAFGVHNAFDHGKLRDRDGGRPMFEPDELARKNVTAGLVFVDTDHGFSLGHDPFARAGSGVVVARFRDDDRDRMLFDSLDRPPTWLYRFDPNAPLEQRTVIVPWSPPAAGSDGLRFEAEAEWPPLAQSGGLAAPSPGPACASASRGLALTPIGGDFATATIALPVPEKARWIVTVRVLHATRTPNVPAPPLPPGRPATGTVRIGDVAWSWLDAVGAGCTDLQSRELDLEPPAARVVLEARTSTVALDRIMLKKK